MSDNSQKKNGSLSPVVLAKLDLAEIGKNLIVGKCGECGNDSFHIKWEQKNQDTISLHALLCTECKFEIKMESLIMRAH